MTKRRRLHDAGIFLVLIGIALMFELIGWSARGASFLFSGQRLLVMVLQVSIVGLLAIGVTQVILTGGIDLSSGSIVALSAMIAASLAQTPNARAVFPALTDLPVLVPVAAGLATGAIAGLVNGSLIAYTHIPAAARAARARRRMPARDRRRRCRGAAPCRGSRSGDRPRRSRARGGG